MAKTESFKKGTEKAKSAAFARSASNLIKNELAKRGITGIAK